MTSIKLYTSETAGSMAVTKETRRIESIFTGKKVEFEKIDVSLDENSDLKEMIKSKNPLPNGGIKLPQVWINDEFKAYHDEIVDANEWGELDKLLG